MKYIKKFENNDDIVYSLNDIVICSTKYDAYRDYTGIINQDGELEYYNRNGLKYGKEYKVIQIYWYSKSYINLTNIAQSLDYSVDVQNIETNKILTNLSSRLFTLKSKWKKPDEPMIGDYVLCKITTNKYCDDYEDFDEYINNNIGRVTMQNNQSEYTIEYRNVPKEMIGEIGYFYNDTNPMIKNLGKHEFKIKDIKFYSKNKKEVSEHLKIIKSSNKFNL